MDTKARFWKTSGGSSVQCSLCPHTCVIGEGARGICGVRENRDGVLYSTVYGHPCTVAADPIEKKPLFHFLPGTVSLSTATAGCNFRCLFCQNYSISQAGRDTVRRDTVYTPKDMVSAASEKNIPSISYTYTEPTVFFEYAYDIGIIAREQGIRNVFVSNGFISHEPREACLDFLDAVNCDLKSFSDETYRDVIGGKLQPVLDSIRFFHENGVWIEVTTLVVPGMNDSDEELEQIAEFIVSVDPGIPWHVSRFYPVYKMQDRPPTPEERVEHAVEIGKKAGITHVYAGNMHGAGHEDTICPSCGELLITRTGFSADIRNFSGGVCDSCGEAVEGVWG